MSRVELPAVPAKRFMGASTRYAFRDTLYTVIVVVAFFGTFSADSRLSALISSMTSYFLAVETLLWALSSFKWLGVARFPSCIEEAFLKEASCVRSLAEVDNHRAICFCYLSVAEPGYFGDLGVIFLPESLSSSSADVACLVKYRNPVDAVHSNGVEVVLEDSRSFYQVCFDGLLYFLVFSLVSTGNSNSVWVLPI